MNNLWIVLLVVLVLFCVIYGPGQVGYGIGKFLAPFFRGIFTFLSALMRGLRP